MQKHGENGLACAKFLESNPRVAKVQIYNSNQNYCVFGLFSARLARHSKRTSVARLRWQLEVRQSTLVAAPET